MVNTLDKIQDLADKINQARHDYYNGEAKVTDRAFDAWYDELKSLDPENPAITKIGSSAVSEWEKVKHKIPMSSLNKVNTPDEFQDWANRKPFQQYVVMDKLDGISINCVYEEGHLTHALTRSDGLIGENILSNVKNMIGVKRVLNNFTGSLRGEIVLTKSNHKKHFADKSNPRNAASGIAKRYDGSGSQYLTVMFYEVIGDIDFATEFDKLEWIKSQGLLTPKYELCKTTEEVAALWRKYQESIRESLDYDIDGVVCPINDIVAQQTVSELGGRPGYSVAFKFDAESRTTVITDLVWSTGNSGRVSPVAVFEPVFLAGATISRASVYNYSYIKELGIDIGAEVLVARNNDVIPSVVEVVTSTGKTAPKPEKCPECGTNVVLEGEYILCPNVDSCPKQALGRLLNWVNQLNLLEWGEAVLTRLLDSGKVSSVADLYKLSANDLAGIDRMGKKSAQNCLNMLWNNSEVSLENFLGGLSIPMVGASIIKMVMSAGYDTLESIQNLTVTQLESVNGLGPAKAQSLHTGLIKNKELIAQLLTNGVKIKVKTVGKLTGKSFAITGSLSMKRTEVEKLIDQHGGVVKSSVGKDTTYLICSAPNGGSSKIASAKKNGTKVISEEELIEMMSL